MSKMYRNGQKDRFILRLQISLLVMMYLILLSGTMVYARTDQITSEMKLQIYNECNNLVALYFYYIDHGQVLKSVDLFTDDAIIKVSPDVGEWRGIESIRKGSQGMEDTITREGRVYLHMYSNFLLTSMSETEATGKAYLTVYRAFGKPGRGESGGGHVAVLEGPEVAGELQYKFVKTEQGWKITYSDIVYKFAKIPSSIFLTAEQFKEYQNMNYSRLLESATSTGDK